MLRLAEKNALRPQAGLNLDRRVGEKWRSMGPFEVLKSYVFYVFLGGGFTISFIFTPIWGRWTHFESCFSDGPKPPTRLDKGWQSTLGMLQRLLITAHVIFWKGLICLFGSWLHMRVIIEIMVVTHSWGLFDKHAVMKQYFETYIHRYYKIHQLRLIHVLHRYDIGMIMIGYASSKSKCVSSFQDIPWSLTTEMLDVISWEVHPRRLTWNIIMEAWKIIFLSKWVICRFHVNLPGCNVKTKTWRFVDIFPFKLACFEVPGWVLWGRSQKFPGLETSMLFATSRLNVYIMDIQWFNHYDSIVLLWVDSLFGIFSLVSYPLYLSMLRNQLDDCHKTNETNMSFQRVQLLGFKCSKEGFHEVSLPFPKNSGFSPLKRMETPSSESPFPGFLTANLLLVSGRSNADVEYLNVLIKSIMGSGVEFKLYQVFFLRTKENLRKGNLPKDAITSVDGSEIWRLPVEMYETFAKNGEILHFWCKFHLLHVAFDWFKQQIPQKIFRTPKHPPTFWPCSPTKIKTTKTETLRKKHQKYPPEV